MNQRGTSSFFRAVGMESAKRTSRRSWKAALEEIPLIGLADDFQAVELALAEGGQDLLGLVFDKGQVHGGQSTRWDSASWSAKASRARDLLEQSCPRALVAPPGRRQLADLGPLVRGHGVEFVLASLAAGQNPDGMELAPRAAAGGFAAFAPQEVERAWGQRPLGGHRAQPAGQSAVLAPESLPESGQFRVHLYLYNTI